MPMSILLSMGAHSAVSWGDFFVVNIFVYVCMYVCTYYLLCANVCGVGCLFVCLYIKCNYIGFSIIFTKYLRVAAVCLIMN